MSKKITWHKLADSIAQLSTKSSGLKEVEIAGKKICIVLQNEQVYACAAKCPHAGGQLSEGYLDALGNMVCPIHRYKFNPANGRNTSGEGYYLKTYLTEIRFDGIYIALEENNF